MKNNELINKSYHLTEREKLKKVNNSSFLLNEIANRIYDSISIISLKFNNCLELGCINENLQKLIKKNNPEIDYFSADISKNILNKLKSKNKKICFDNDKWVIKNEYFELITSNLYLHWSNNILILFNNIINSLKKNGFFICSLPGTNNLFELKNAMLNADINFYNGAYQRFPFLHPINFYHDLLMKNNFKIPLIETDNLTLKYNNFDSLLTEINDLDKTNVLINNLKIKDNKDYYKKVEEFYWKKFSYENKLLLTIQIFYLSGWKYHESQQKPIRPGEAKYLLKDALK